MPNCIKHLSHIADINPAYTLCGQGREAAPLVQEQPVKLGEAVRLLY